MSRTAWLLLLAGCAGTIRGYEGERLPPEEAALIVSHSASSIAIRIAEVDGAPIDRKWSRLGSLELPPGIHSIALQVSWKAGLFRFPASPALDPATEAKNLVLLGVDAATARRGTVDVLVDLEAGRRYVLVARAGSGGQAICRITDAETGALVAGEQLDGIFAFE